MERDLAQRLTTLKGQTGRERKRETHTARETEGNSEVQRTRETETGVPFLAVLVYLVRREAAGVYGVSGNRLVLSKSREGARERERNRERGDMASSSGKPRRNRFAAVADVSAPPPAPPDVDQVMNASILWANERCVDRRIETDSCYSVNYNNAMNSGRAMHNTTQVTEDR